MAWWDEVNFVLRPVECSISCNRPLLNRLTPFFSRFTPACQLMYGVVRVIEAVCCITVWASENAMFLEKVVCDGSSLSVWVVFTKMIGDLPGLDWEWFAASLDGTSGDELTWGGPGGGTYHGEGGGGERQKGEGRKEEKRGRRKEEGNGKERINKRRG